jgi:hypothetical protein
MNSFMHNNPGIIISQNEATIVDPIFELKKKTVLYNN